MNQNVIMPILGLIAFSFIPALASPIDVNVPPTRAFAKLYVGANHVTAMNYLGQLNITAGAGISLALANGTTAPSLTITNTGSGGSGNGGIFINGLNRTIFTGILANQSFTFPAPKVMINGLNASKFTIQNVTINGHTGQVFTINNVTDTNTAQIKNADGAVIGLFGSRTNATQNTIKTLSQTGCITLADNGTDIQIGCTTGGVNSLNFTTSSDFDFRFLPKNMSWVKLVGTIFQFNNKPNIFLTNESAQTVTKNATFNTFTLGGTGSAHGNRIQSLGVPTFAQDVARADKFGLLGSLVVGKCSNTQTIQYQSSNSTWICATASSSSGLSTTQNAGHATGSVGTLATPTTSIAKGRNFTGTSPITVTKTNDTDVAIGCSTCLTGSPNYLAAQPGNPGGTASTTGVMSGIGGTCKITPSNSGIVFVIVSGQGTSNTGDDGEAWDLRISAVADQAAPANGAALSGTVLKTKVIAQNVASSSTTDVNTTPFSVQGVAAGLSTGHVYWIDTGQYAVTGGTATFTNIQCDAYELK